MERSSESKINVLANIDNYFGEHGSRLTPVLIFLLAIGLPPVLWLFILRAIISWKIGLVIELFWVARVALFIFGHENEKLEVFLQAVDDEYATSEDIIRISNIYEDGLVEYRNGQIAYIVSCFGMGYFNDDSFSVDFENFLNKLKGYQYDVYCHLMVDEYELQANLERLKVYKDAQMLKERMDFYIAQDKYCMENTQLYRIDIVVKGYKYDRKDMHEYLETITTVDTDMFKWIYICDSLQAQDVVSRNLGTEVDLEQMLVKRYKNEEYRGSEVLYYDNELPEKLKVQAETPNIRSRRVIYKEEGE